ncbi:MAG: rRNA maturation RNase YbeY [Chloroflexi bacterium]|nr:rRNA maturation RNase YbeY [Chloroflexota bacterium]
MALSNSGRQLLFVSFLPLCYYDPDMEINVLIDDKFEGKVDATWLEGIATQTLKAEGMSANAEMGLVITGQDKIRELNKTYRGKDRPTDVMAFYMLPTEGKTAPESEAFITPPDDKVRLGEVVISYPQAVIQAEERNHPIEKEMAILVIHGVLHLLGYDDEKPEPKKKMVARETEILALVEGRDAK